MADYKALYRKYRPTDFDDVCGQKAITDILKYQVSSGKLSHAYLFCGSRGTGKTSCAKILAKAVNCENPINGNPCNKCEACKSCDSGIATDVIEMDAASNNGIGNVRDMKDEIAFTPALLKYRVYIIDEVHMMSGSAFNALLKTLEEPPAYVIFILATTEFHKLPTTIVSRCQRYDFRRMTNDVIVERLKKISALENIELAEDGANMIARVSEGGMRDAVSLLELCAGARVRIDEELVFRTVGRGSRQGAYSIMSKLLSSDLTSVYSALSEVIAKGSDISVFWSELIDAYRDLLVVKTSKSAKTYLDLTDTEYEQLCKLSESFTMPKLLYHTSVLEDTVADLQRAREAKRSIAEIALAKMCSPKLECSKEALLLRIEELERSVSKIKLGVGTAEPIAEPKPEVPKEAPKSTPKQESPLPKQDSVSESKSEPYRSWGRVVAGVESIKPSIYTPLSKATVIKTSDGVIEIKIEPFFVNIIGDDKENIAILKGLISECEQIPKESVKIKILPKAKGEVATLADELFGAINS